MSEYGRAVWRHLAVSEIERVVQAEGGRTIVLDLVGLSREEIGDEVEKLVSSGVNNLIVLGRTMLDHGDHLALGVMHAVRRVGRAIPVVWAEASDRLNWPFDSVRYDCRQGSLNAVQHLIDLGHRRIALLAPGATMMWANERIVGFHQAMELSGLPSSDDDVVRADDLSMAIDNYWPIVGRSAADRFLANRGDYTAAVCMNDSIGCQLIAAARECGISVPGDLSVTGFDDSLEARRMGLTSVQLENAAFGRTTALRAIECLRNPRAGVLTDTRLIPTLVVRSSTAPPPAR
jgi:DNA-binding LacI/PurR family transcriptional regulator